MVIATRLFFWIALAVGLALAWLPPAPGTGAINDKIQHMAGFAALTVLAIRAFPATPLARIAERLSFVGAMVELVQSIPAIHRDCDIMDWVADTAAILGVTTVVWVYRRIRRAPAASAS